MRYNRERRGVSEIVGILLMLAVVISLGVLIFAFASGGMNSLSENYASGMAGRASAAREKFVVEQVAFASPGTLALDGTSTNQVVGSSSSISASLTTTSANDVVVAYVSPADAGASTPPSVSGVSGGGLAWTHRASTSAETFTQYYVPVTLTNNAVATPAIDGSATGCFGATQTAPCVTGTTSGTVTLTTTSANDVIVVEVSNEHATAGPTRTVSTLACTSACTGLSTFSLRKANTQAGTFQDLEAWWATATSALTSSVFTVTLSGATDDAVIVAFGVSGANTASPWDSSGPVTTTGAAGTTPSVTGFATSNSNDMLLGFESNGNIAGVAATVETTGLVAGTAGTIPANGQYDNEGGNSAEDGAVEYRDVTSTVSGASVAFGTATTASDAWIIIADAITAGGAPTANPFQQQVTWNPSTYATYEAPDLGNIRFCSDNACASPLFAWLESCTTSCGTGATSATAWVQLTSPIPGKGGSLTIYMVFLGTSVEFDGNYWGEAPQLSGTYAQYDNGANVFTNYWNFAGTSCPSGWTCSGATISNGISAASAASYAYTTATYGLTANVLDFYGTFPLATSVNNAGLGYDHDTPNGPNVMWTINTNTGGAGCASTRACLQTGLTGGTYSFLSTFTTTGAHVYGIYWGSTASATAYYDYANSATSSTDIPTSALSIGIFNAQGAQATIGPFDWVRLRVYPPGGAMPSASLGSTSSNSVTFDAEEWYAVASSPLSSASVTATLSSSDSAATWIAVLGVSGGNTASPFDSSLSLPATSSGTSPSATISTSNANDMLLYGCAANAGGIAAGFTSIYSNTYPPDQNEYVGYEAVSATQTNLVTSCGTNSYGAQITDAVVGSYGGADIFVRNVGSVPTTLVSVYVMDTTSDAFVSQTTISTTMNVGTFVEITPSNSAFTPTVGHTYSFTVTSSRGNSVVYKAEEN